jgi:NAD+-dependent secondary alcohol dehydrogenase Adh1
MHAGGPFPGIDSDGGYAELLKTAERAVVKLPRTLAPKDVAPYADAGLTAYHAVKKATANLAPGDCAVVIGVGGLGHIGVQVLKAMSAVAIIAVDRTEVALTLARESGADHIVRAGPGDLDQVMAMTDGLGAQVVIDFVGEGDSVTKGLKMTRNAGYYYIVGYGGKVEVSTMDMIVSEKSIVGNLVGTYADLVELMALADRGLVKLATREYRLADANNALNDLKNGQVKGRAVLIP